MAVNQAPRFVVPLDAGRFQTRSLSAGDDTGWAMVLQGGGVFVAGSGQGASGLDFALLRLRADGTPDASVGTTGVRLLSIGSADDQAFGMAVQADGRLVLAGRTATGTDRSDAAVARLRADGQTDTTFGNGGTVVLDFGGTLDSAAAVAARADGSLVVAGTTATGSGADFALARLKTDGTLDTAFGTGGKVVVPFGTGADRAHALALQTDGSILAVGESVEQGVSHMAIVRLRSDGTLDTSFGIGGKVVVPSAVNATARAVAVQPDGLIVLAGSIDDGANANFMVVRLTASGSTDASFGSNGVVTVSPGSGPDHATGIALQSDGRIVVAGYSTQGTDTDFSVVRLNANGTLDESFSGDGKALVAISTGADFARAVAVLADGQVLLGGDAAVTGGRDVVVVRLSADGEPDRAYGAADTLTGSVATFMHGGAAVRLDADAAVFDAELALQGHYNGAALSLSRAGGTSAEDRFSALPGGPLTFTEGRVLLSGVEVGTVFEGVGTLSVRFNSQATPARVNEVMRNVAYANVGVTPPPSINLHWTFADGNQGGQGTGGLGTVTATTEVRIRTSNAAPVSAGALPAQAWNEGTLSTFVVPANAFTDADGEPLTYSVTLTDGSAVPAWMQFAAGTRTLSGTPPVGSDNLTVRVRATDEAGLFATADLFIRTPGANEGLQLTGTDFADVLTGSHQADQLSGGKGDDTLTGGRGNDQLDGGQGNDTVIFSGPFSEYRITAGTGADTYVVTDTVADRDGTDTLVAVELMRFSDGLRSTGDRPAPGNPGQTLTGTDAADRLVGTADNDTIDGRLGNDTLIGGNGNDTLIGGKGDDQLDADATGRGGADTMSG
ncbi:MAG: hypothetical protein RJA10_3645, partial [Pseudomonadota bacterium]